MSADKIRYARLKSGKAVGVLAEALGVEADFYQSLEQQDDAIDLLTLGQLQKLLVELDLQVRECIPSISAHNEAEDVKTFTQLRDLARQKQQAAAACVDYLNELFGYDIEWFFADPESAWENMNLECLSSLATWLNVRVEPIFQVTFQE